MQPMHHSQHTTFLLMVALLFCAASPKHPFEAGASNGDSPCIQPFDSNRDVVNAPQGVGRANTSFDGFRVRSYPSPDEDNRATAGIGAAPGRPMRVVIVDGHPHNPSKLGVQRLSMVANGSLI